MAFPGEVTSTNGDQVSSEVVEWKLRPGVVSTMSAQARYTDPSARSFTGAAIWLGVASFLVAGIIGGLAYVAGTARRARPEPESSANALVDRRPGLHKPVARSTLNALRGEYYTDFGKGRPLSVDAAAPSAVELAGAVTDQLREYLRERRGDARIHRHRLRGADRRPRGIRAARW